MSDTGARDVLVRDVPAPVLDALTRRAADAGVSRVEYLRRVLAADAARDDEGE